MSELEQITKLLVALAAIDWTQLGDLAVRIGAENWDQLGIGVFGVAAIWLSQDQREQVRRWACIAGLVGQPFWFAATAANGQWGIFALSFAYTWAWWKGFRTHWLPKKPAATA